MNRNHLNVDIKWLLRELESRKWTKAKNKFALAFLSEWDSIGIPPYMELIGECTKALSEWKTCFCSSECDNVRPDWSCWGHSY